MSEVQCPKCGNTVPSLIAVDAATIASVKASSPDEEVPSQVCESCFSSLGGSPRAKGSMLLQREKAKEQKKLMLWKSRVNLIKKARQDMSEKAFSEAAVAYEKYLKVLEIIFDCQHGELTPEHFKDSARTQELTIVASVYWDLLRIYDTSEKYGDRQGQAARKLSQFLRFTPIFPDIIRRAESFARSAKNPSVIKSFVKDASDEKGRCFIATSAFESPVAAEVISLQVWRDSCLMNHVLGQIFVKIYYLISPPIARFLDIFSFLKPLVRLCLRTLIYLAVRQR